MGWAEKLVGGFILTILLISTATAFFGYLAATGQSCGPSTASSASSTSGAPPAAPAATDELVLAPLDNLSLPRGGSGSLAYLTNATFWGEVDASELQAYEQLVPQTVLGFINSSQAWRDWALQRVPDPPAWIATGVVAAAQEEASGVGPGAGNSTAVEGSIREFAASAAGVSLAALDFVSFNGLTAYKTLVSTGDPVLAACETLPGQLAQLFESSFASGAPPAQRADYLGKAIAVTSVMLLLGGAGGFEEHFQVGLGDVGLAGSWATVKPYLGDIGVRVSAGAASTVMGILETLAARFPQDSAFVTGFTADRIDSMVAVLEKKGVSNDAIQGDLGQIAQAAGSSSDDEVAGEVADVESLQQGGWMQVYVRSGNKMVLYEDTSGDTAAIRGTFLQEVIPGFNPRGPNFVQIHYREAGVTVYHYYGQKVAAGAPYTPGDTTWFPVAPASVASNGDTIMISFSLLTTQDFVRSIPAISYDDAAGASWVTDFSEITGFELAGNQLAMRVEQEPLEGVWNFAVAGQASPLTYVGGDTFIQFRVADLVNNPETLKITYNGFGAATLSIKSGDNFYPVTLVSNDGVKLKFVYNSGGNTVAVNTIYLQEPSVLWTLGTANEENLGFAVQGATQTFKVAQVAPARDLEREMVNSGDKYDLARVGAEIAYTAAQKDFGLQDIQLNEPSQGGADLTAADGTVTIQARMLGSPSALSTTNLQSTLESQMNELSQQVSWDFANNKSAQTGYAVLSYLDPGSKTIVTLVAVIPRP